MSRHGFTDLSASLRDGGDLTQILEAIQSGHIDTGRPDYAVPGMVWADQIDADTIKLMLHVGGSPAADVAIGTADLVAGTFQPETGAVDYQEFTANGTWTKPSGCTLVMVEIVAGGASGAAVENFDGDGRASGGGGGGAGLLTLPASLFGPTEAVTVGTGGAAVNDPNQGNDGGDSSFGPLTATGGTGGTLSTTDPSTESGASGTLNVAAYSDAAGSGGEGEGGGAPGETSALYGDGGASNSNSNGEDGEAPGGGGGGGVTTSGGVSSGAGADGRVRVWAW